MTTHVSPVTAQAEVPTSYALEFEPRTIEHLGMRLYSKLPPAIGELVANAWDADASKVQIVIPTTALTESSEVTVRDFGSGMSPTEVQSRYLVIGRNCRQELKAEQTPGGRPIMGRKGLGKLAPFGVASVIRVRTIKDAYSTCLELDFEAMRATPIDRTYNPRIIKEFSGPTAEPSGTEIRISHLHRKTAIDVDAIRKDLARRFTVVGGGMVIEVNGKPVGPGDRRLKEQCKKAWDASELPGGGLVDEATGLAVGGWVGLLEKSSNVDRGVDIFARGRAVEMESMFNLKTTHAQFARAYVIGEIHAEFLDAEKDYVGTGRNTALWEEPPAVKLQEWGQTALTWVFSRWKELQRKAKEAKVHTPDFTKWLEGRQPRERRVAERILNIILDDDNVEPESAAPLLEAVKVNIEFQAFQDLVDEIEEAGSTDVATLLKLFGDWEIIEAREHLKLADGRREVTRQLQTFIKEDAKEVEHIQPLFERNGWLIDPAWSSVEGQKTYSKLLREKFPEAKDLAEEDRRLDIIAYVPGGEMTIVELKRPRATLNAEHLSQVEAYVDWARANTVGAEKAPTYVRGLLVVGRMSKDAALQRKVERLAGADIRVTTFTDLLARAEDIYQTVDKKLRAVAPEYSREARKVSHGARFAQIRGKSAT